MEVETGMVDMYAGAITRLCFLAGVGLGPKKGREAAARKSK